MNVVDATVHKVNRNTILIQYKIGKHVNPTRRMPKPASPIKPLFHSVKLGILILTKYYL
jgi:hypothetical protein